MRAGGIVLQGGPTPVHRNGGAGQLRRCVTAQKHGKAAKLIHRDELLRRLAGEHDLLHRLVLGNVIFLRGVGNLRLDQRRQDISGADGVGRDRVLVMPTSPCFAVI